MNPLFWTDPDVKGVTLWGYTQGYVWRTNSYLVRSDGTARPALAWLIQYVSENPAGVKQLSGLPPATFLLSQNYPNPFNPTTNIGLGIPDLSR